MQICKSLITVNDKYYSDVPLVFKEVSVFKMVVKTDENESKYIKKLNTPLIALILFFNQ